MAIAYRQSVAAVQWKMGVPHSRPCAPDAEQGSNSIAMAGRRISRRFSGGVSYTNFDRVDGILEASRARYYSFFTGAEAQHAVPR